MSDQMAEHSQLYAVVICSRLCGHGAIEGCGYSTIYILYVQYKGVYVPV